MEPGVNAPAATSAGVALIAAPVLGFALKATFSPGWILIIAIWLLGVFLLAGYVLQLVIAVGSMMRRRGRFRQGEGSSRAIWAAWLTSAGIAGLGFFLVDGGDDGRSGSAMTMLFGLETSGIGGSLSMGLAQLCGWLWIGGWVWLVVEWFTRAIRDRRARRLQAAPPHPPAPTSPIP